MPSPQSNQRRSRFAARSFCTNLHLVLAAIFAPIVVLMAVSGGLYLLGIKGSASERPVPLPPGTTLELHKPDAEAGVRQLLTRAGIEHRFEYLKQEDNVLITRPTSRPHYVLRIEADGLRLTHVMPDLQRRMIELHKGHGPTAFKTLQKVMAVGLLLIVSSGFWLGLSDASLRRRLIPIGGLGLLLFIVTGFIV